MVRRISHPNRPIILIDEGPANGMRHWYAEAREDLDEKLATRMRHEPIRLRQPWRPAA